MKINPDNLHKEGFEPMFEPRHYLNPYLMFYKMYGYVPSKRIFHDIDKKELLKVLKTKFNPGSDAILVSDTWKKDEQTHLNTVVISLEKELFVFFSSGGPYEPCVEILYGPNLELGRLEDLSKLISSVDEKDERPRLYLLCAEHFGLDVRPFEIRKTELDIQTHYNEDFEPIHERIFNRLKGEKDKGIVLLYGEPGTGKTSYIRYLISNLENKKMIYVPPDLAPKIADPGLLSLLAENPDSILIIEDAESILMERSEAGDGAISNLLNLADGLLADCLNIQILCTFNVPLAKVDKALLRKGRIIASYEMKKLNQAKTASLIKRIYGTEYDGEGLSLADIYNFGDPSFLHGKKPIGFRN